MRILFTFLTFTLWYYCYFRCYELFSIQASKVPSPILHADWVRLGEVGGDLITNTLSLSHSTTLHFTNAVLLSGRWANSRLTYQGQRIKIKAAGKMTPLSVTFVLLSANPEKQAETLALQVREQGSGKRNDSPSITPWVGGCSLHSCQDELPFLHLLPTKRWKSLGLFSSSYILKLRWVCFFCFHVVFLEKVLQGRKLTTQFVHNQSVSFAWPGAWWSKRLHCLTQATFVLGINLLAPKLWVLVSHLKFWLISLILMHLCNKQPQ